ncbi:hypothetical protein V6N11_067224 [Hibiscus sabdariffa]|uniref:Uncharacterized protein n=1 Tax=Hibiscus sabdariffa TaxID=183260 RepID=A0ABR2SQ23_9ROSI
MNKAIIQDSIRAPVTVKVGLNIIRCVHRIYKYGDFFGIQTHQNQECVMSILEPIPMDSFSNFTSEFGLLGCSFEQQVLLASRGAAFMGSLPKLLNVEALKTISRVVECGGKETEIVSHNIEKPFTIKEVGHKTYGGRFSFTRRHGKG